MTCLQLCVLFNIQICVTFPLVFMNNFFKVEANPVEMRCQCFYSAVMANSKLDYFADHLVWTNETPLIVERVVTISLCDDLWRYQQC